MGITPPPEMLTPLLFYIVPITFSYNNLQQTCPHTHSHFLAKLPLSLNPAPRAPFVAVVVGQYFCPRVGRLGIGSVDQVLGWLVG